MAFSFREDYLGQTITCKWSFFVYLDSVTFIQKAILVFKDMPHRTKRLSIMKD